MLTTAPADDADGSAPPSLLDMWTAATAAVGSAAAAATEAVTPLMEGESRRVSAVVPQVGGDSPALLP